MSRTATTGFPAWLAQPHAVDVVTSALLDSADRDEAEAQSAGRPRLAAANIRQLRHYANTLAAHGTTRAMDETPDGGTS